MSTDRIAYLIQISELVRNFGLVVAAAVGVALAWWRSRASNRQAAAALRQAEVAQRDHVVEMFNRAIDQLGSEKLEVRKIGGSLGVDLHSQTNQPRPALCRVQGPILETLTAYVRERTRDDSSAEPPVDVREIMSLLNEALAEPRNQEA